MGSSRVEQALNELDPGSRAVVDLSLGTDFSDENIATLIRVEPDEVARRRDRAIDVLQQKLGGASHDDVVLELCAAMGVEPSSGMLDGSAQNGADRAGTTANGSQEVVDQDAGEAAATEADLGDDAPDAHPDLGGEVPDVRPDHERGADEPALAPVPEPEHPAEPAIFDESPAAVTPDREAEAEAAPEPDATPEPQRASEQELESHPDTERRREAPEPALEREPFTTPPPPSSTRARDGGSGSGRRRLAVLFAALLAGAALVAGVIALSSGEGSDSEPIEPQTPASGQPADSGATPEPQVSATLEPLPDAPAGGQADVSLDGDRLEVELDGLPQPEGSYEAWLFTSVLESRPLGATDDGSGTITARLPASADRFEYLDVSVQPSSDAQHSGQSIFRVPIADLTE